MDESPDLQNVEMVDPDLQESIASTSKTSVQQQNILNPELDKCINDLPGRLPNLVMEYILAHFSYHEILQFRLISRHWDETIQGIYFW